MHCIYHNLNKVYFFIIYFFFGFLGLQVVVLSVAFSILMKDPTKRSDDDVLLSGNKKKKVKDEDEESGEFQSPHYYVVWDIVMTKT